ncbi:HrpE/YscL family type III secretion apparatus protein [Erwinia sp. E_sp_W01_6]|uniref:HrpE/YscL family type III secretion apparatus protein n=1 Tax=Erwinia sp. E_sp_W01_6 TaxID=3039408 RepID=UPI0030CCFC91
MWITRKIALFDPQLSTGPILSREDLAGHQQALTLLQQAEQQAQARLDAASEQAENLLEAARERSVAESQAQQAEQQQDFLVRTGALFSDWQAQQQSWQAALLPQAEALLAQAMNQLLAELPPRPASSQCCISWSKPRAARPVPPCSARQRINRMWKAG